MTTVFRYTLSRYLGAILGWGLTLALLGLYIISLYDTILSQQAEFVELVDAYPPELMAAFGDFTQLASPSGYLQFTFFSYAPLIVGFFALLAGSALIVADEEKGILDLVIAYPVSRGAFYFGRCLAFILSLIFILIIGWGGFLLLVPQTQLGLSAGEVLMPFLSLFGILFFFGTISLLLSLVLPSRGLATTMSGLLLLAGFFITTLERLDENLGAVARFSPLNYYQGGLAVDGLNWGWLLGLVGIGLVLTLVGWWRFERRDIRVAGEAGWSFRRYPREHHVNTELA